MNSSKCRSCGQSIQWIKTTAGKNMPLDLDEIKAHEAQPGTVLVTLSGQTHVVNAERNQPNVKGFLSHFATCPDSSQWRGIR